METVVKANMDFQFEFVSDDFFGLFLFVRIGDEANENS